MQTDETVFQCPFYPQKRTCAAQLGMSALCQKRTRAMQLAMSAMGQKRTHAAQQKESLFDHLVSEAEQFGWHFNAERLGGF
jgi:hypothetical protein